MKKLLSLVLAVIMIASIAAVIIIPTSAEEPTTTYASYYTGNKDVSWYYEEDGITPKTPDATEYTLMSADQLAGLAYIVGNDFIQFRGVTIKLGVDIVWNPGKFTVDANGEALYNGATPVVSGENANVFEYTPIGDRDACRTPNNTPHNSAMNLQGQFYGSFDGQGHTVSGLYYDAPTEGFSGFFSIFCGREIKNLSIVNSYFAGHSRSGVFAGFVVGAVASGENQDVVSNLFENLYTDAYIIVKGTENNSRSGGIFGMVRPMPTNTYPDDTDPADNGFKVVLNKCWFNGTIWATHSTKYNGGLVGLAAMDDNHSPRLNASNGAPNDDGRDHLIEFNDCLVTGTINNVPEPASVDKTNPIRIGLIMGGLYRGKTVLNNCVVALSATNIDESTSVTITNAMGIPETHKFLPAIKDVTDEETGATTQEEVTGKGILGYYESVPCDVTYNNVFFVPIGMFQKHLPLAYVDAAQGTVKDHQKVTGEPTIDKTLASASIALATSGITFTNVEGKFVPSIAGLKTTVDPVDPSITPPDPSKVTEPTTTLPIIVTEPKPVVTTKPAEDKPQETKAPVTTANKDDEKSCGGFTAIGALLALIAVTGAAVVIKKK